jgi:NADH-quinone oxidoreductase subunit C
MLLAKIKEALASLYEDIEVAEEAPDAAEAVADDTTAAEESETEAPAAADGAATAAAEQAQAEDAAPEQEDTEAEEEPQAPPGPRNTDYPAKGYHLDVDLPPEKIPAAAEILLKENFFIESITGVDWIDDGQLESVYDFNHFDELCRVVLRTHDFFGIKFIGHPNLEPLLLPEDADFHPLLKDFKA